jgi:hypothetical protein
MHRILPALAAAFFLSSCGYIGGPLPPLANIPANVTDLAAVQRGTTLIVQFTVPSLTTEGMAIKTPLKLDLRIGTGVDPFSLGAWADQAEQIPEGRVTNGIARYEVPTTRWTGKDAIIAVRAVGSNGKPGVWSNLVTCPVVTPPDKPTDVRAESVAAGVLLTWSARGEHFRVLRRAGETGSFTQAAAGTGHQWTDADAEYGKPYSYLVQTTVDLGNGREAESDLSAAIAITPEDKSPPAVPANLSAIPAPGSAELSWDRNTEPDLAGYRVYRAAAGGAFQKIANTNEIPTYSDHAVEPGKTYRYAVSAVDKAGNESALSSPVEVTLQ